MIFVCQKCGLPVPMKAEEFPLKCRCGMRYESFADSAGAGTARVAPPPPLPIFEIERRLSICKSGCEHWNEEKQGCKVCGTCGSGQAMLNGLLRDPAKKCPHPKGNRWGTFNPLKVVFLTPGLSCGGAERWILSLCQKFDPLKIWVQAIGVEGKGWIDPMMKEQVPKHIRVVDGWEKILPYAQGADVVIVWGSPGMIDLAKASGKPFVVVVHGSDAESSYGGRIARKGVDAGGIAAAVNEACLACYPEEYRRQVTIIANGADEDRVTPVTGREVTRKELGIGDGQKMLLYLGRAMKDKHVDKLRAVAETLPPEWVTICAGNTDAFGREHIGGRLRLVEPRNHVGDLLAAADVQTLLSPSEAHPLSVTEGWLAGVPTVVSELPWIESIPRKHGPMSWLAPKDATAEETAAIVLEADAAGRGSEQVLFAQETAKLEYTAKAMAGRWASFLTAILSRDS